MLKMGEGKRESKSYHKVCMGLVVVEVMRSIDF